MTGPDYRTAAEYFRDKAHAERRALLDGTEPVKTTAKSNKERQAALKARRIAAGLVPIHLWAHAADVQAIRDHAAKLARRRERQSKRGE